MSSSGSGPCGNLKDERSLGQNPGQEDPESCGSYYSPGLLPWAQFTPLSLEDVSVSPEQHNYGAGFASCIGNLEPSFLHRSLGGRALSI